MDLLAKISSQGTFKQSKCVFEPFEEKDAIRCYENPLVVIFLKIIGKVIDVPLGAGKTVHLDKKNLNQWLKGWHAGISAYPISETKQAYTDALVRTVKRANIENMPISEKIEKSNKKIMDLFGFETLSKVDISQKQGKIGTLDFFLPSDLKNPIMRGKDLSDLDFFVIRGTNAKSGLQRCQVFFQTSKDTASWEMTNHPDSSQIIIGSSRFLIYDGHTHRDLQKLKTLLKERKFGDWRVE